MAKVGKGCEVKFFVRLRKVESSEFEVMSSQNDAEETVIYTIVPSTDWLPEVLVYAKTWFPPTAFHTEELESSILLLFPVIQ